MREEGEINKGGIQGKEGKEEENEDENASLIDAQDFM
jgi:hypothetical protein